MKDVWALREEGKVKVVLTDDMTISRRRSPGGAQPSVWHVPGIGDTTFPAHEGGQNNLKIDACNRGAASCSGFHCSTTFHLPRFIKPNMQRSGGPAYATYTPRVHRTVPLRRGIFAPQRSRSTVPLP